MNSSFLLSLHFTKFESKLLGEVKIGNLWLYDVSYLVSGSSVFVILMANVKQRVGDELLVLFVLLLIVFHIKGLN